ncbi:MAG: hypothetical protein LBK77_07050 [Spirochaetaceae bacterium]|jgi:hypothetical protein|nr:hypothetical protein [Spirochaetaceae bacterium]
MKKCLVILLALAALAMGCKSAPEPEADPRSKIIGAEGVSRPDWMNKTPKSDDTYYVIGDGRPGMSKTAQQGTARIDAQAKVAQWKAAVVADTVKNYMEESGTPGSTQILMNFQQATITRSTANVAGFDEVEHWIDQEGVYHGLFMYPKTSLKNDFENSVSEFQRNQAAAFAEFKAQEAYKYLETQLDTHE